MPDLSRREALGSLAVAAAAQVRRARRPNLLFLMADDHAGYVLGVDGNRQAETPALDRLAAEGVRFARHFCNSPVCTPSRQSLLTGLLPHAAGVTVLRTPLDPARPTLPKQLQKAGYRTAAIGKMHFNRPSEAGLHGFHHLAAEDVVNRAWNGNSHTRLPVPTGIATKPPWKPFQDPARIWLNADKLPFPAAQGEMKGNLIAQWACEFLEENRDRPFALWTSFLDPHSPFDFPLEDRDRFHPSNFRVPRPGPEDAWQVPLIFRSLTDRDKQGINAAYYTSVRFLDRNLAVVLDKLRQLRLEENTVVVYLADHGYSLGQHGRFEKHCGYDPALRVPLIVSRPGTWRARAVQDLTEHVDVTATLADILDLDPLPAAHGRSLRHYVEGRRPALSRDWIFSEYLENEEAFARTARWKLIYGSGKRHRQDGYATDQPTPGRYVRLFDLDRDPGEFTNVAEQNQGRVAQMLGFLRDRFRTTHPEADREPPGSLEQALDFYLRPRDA